MAGAGQAKYRPYPAYKPSGVAWLGDIPEGWESKRLKHTVQQSRQITYGIVQAGPNLEVGIPYIRPADMTDEKGIRDFSSLMHTSPQIAADYERSKIQGGDLVCSIGPSFGKVMVVPDTLGGANLTQGTARIAIDTETSARFMFWALRSPITFQQWESSVGGATFRALNLGPLAETHLSLPPLPEQTKIAAFLDYETAKIDGLIAKQQRLIALLEEKRQAVISHAVTKGLDPTAPLRPSGIEWLGDVPAHWEVKRVKQVAALNPSKSELQNWSGQTKVTFLPMEAIGDRGELNTSAERELREVRSGYTYVRENDVCIAKITPCFENGKGAVMTGLKNSIAFGTTELIPMRCSSKILPHFLYFLLVSAPFNKTAEGSMYGAGGQKRVADFFVANYYFSLPSRNEQTEIVVFIKKQLEQFYLLDTKAQSAIVLLKERRTALISAAVTGKIDLRDWHPPEGTSESYPQDIDQPEEALA
ncbi:restriction endonuclease subunit S [Yoonia sediminilitoris]|uniref:Type I restriction enzyme S subunit n=1 Tax=Yoonia sediminilitoris TaxID=1286148 RepID=A0A2T6KI34_9RHOB|nr:restriction endonuclease subunit S [Yoonia sediminilitoris]PUB15384.1 type I restriction enzyme S subunit [Yoonia sediminilitoris]RCW95994.1 type I restriction enzyme S subunit [Yoonia sediminilitoris]